MNPRPTDHHSHLPQIITISNQSKQSNHINTKFKDNEKGKQHIHKY